MPTLFDPLSVGELELAKRIVMAPLRLADLHVIEGQTGGARDFAAFDYAALRRRFAGAWMVPTLDAALA